MDYLQTLLQRAFTNTWNLVFDRSFLSAVIALGIFFGTFWFLRCRKQHEEAKRALRDFGIAALITACAFLVVFLLNVLIFTPAALYSEEHAAKKEAEKAKTAAENALKSATPAPITFDVKDVEVRKELETVKTELAAANKAMKERRIEADPLDKPLLSARFFIVLKRRQDESKKEKPSSITDYGPSTGAALMKDGQLLIMGSTIQYFNEGDGGLNFTVNCSFDNPMMGKPVRSLAENARSLVLNFPAYLLPAGIEIESASVTLIINSQNTVTLNIPKFVVTDSNVRDKQTQMTFSGDGLLLRELITPPSSPTPSKEASQPSPAS